MTDSEIRTLRAKQFLYQNLAYLFYGLILVVLISSGASGPVVYGVLAVILLITPLSIWLFQKSHILLSQLSALRKLEEYEKTKLEGAWRKFYSTSSWLQVAVSIYFFVQVLIRDPHKPFAEGIPFWYYLVISLAFFLFANWNDWSNARNIDRKTTQELKSFTEDRFLFTVIFGCVALGLTGIGVLVVNVMSSIQVP